MVLVFIFFGSFVLCSLRFVCVRALHLYAATYSHYSLSLATTQSSIAELLLLFNLNILGWSTTT
jgi:hypothetical protein